MSYSAILADSTLARGGCGTPSRRLDDGRGRFFMFHERVIPHFQGPRLGQALDVPLADYSTPHSSRPTPRVTDCLCLEEGCPPNHALTRLCGGLSPSSVPTKRILHFVMTISVH